MFPCLGLLLAPLLGLPAGPFQGPQLGGPRARALPFERPLAQVHELLPSGIDTSDIDITALVSGDLDGDGDLDAVLGVCSLGDWGNYPVPEVVYLNLGGARFREASSLLPPYFDIVADIGAADIDGDGDLDLLITNDDSLSSAPGPDHLCRNRGDARFVDASAGLVPGSDRGRIRFGDVDGDGDVDVLYPRAHSSTAPRTELHSNQGAGAFVDVTPSLPSGSGFFDGRFGDVDRDGDLDVVLSGNTTALWLNDGSGGLSDASAGHVPLALGAGEFELGDLDGDLDLDFASFSRVLLNDGGAIFTDRAVPAGPVPPFALVDVDGDGDLDLFGPTRRLTNDGLAFFSPASAPMPDLGYHIAAFEAGDFDGDGDMDALGAEWGEYLGSLDHRADFLLLNDHQGTFTDSRTLPDVFERPSYGPIALGPLTGHANADLVLYSWPPPQRLQVFRGDGTGRFVAPVTLTYIAGPGEPHEFQIARLDQDTWSDLVVAGPSGVKIFFGPTLAPAPTPVVSETLGVEPGDFDGDGDGDLVTRDALARNRLLIQTTPRTFTLASATRFPQLAQTPNAVDSLDAESDGDLDIVFAQASAKLYINQGPATFVDASATHVPPVPAWEVSAGDVNGDGAPDLFLGSFSDQNLLLNQGDGHFVARPDLLPAAPGALYGHLLLDADLDGDLDALNDYWGLLFENDGRGSFQHSVEVSESSNSVAGDLDGDGDVDLVSRGAYGESLLLTVLRNRSRQLTWLTLPSIGKPLELEILGPPFEAYTLASAADRTRTVTPFGTVWLDPSSISIVSRGRLDESGTKRCNFAIPATPALIGTTHYWQALVGRHPHLTNLEATTFTGL
jgi:hypothetical protein